MISISSMYTNMMNSFGRQNSYYQSQKTRENGMGVNNAIYNYYDRMLTEKRNAQLDKGIEKTVDRIRSQVASTQKQQAALKSAQELSGTLTDKMEALKANADRLKTTGFSSVLKPLGYGSQNENVAAVVSGGSQDQSNIELKVNQLAAKQMTHFQGVDSNAKDVLSGASSMKLTINGESKTVNFDIAAGMTAQEALNSISATVNQSDLGVKASVTQVDGKSILSLVSDETGKSQSFRAEFTGKLNQEMKVQSTVDARDAEYTVNGQTQTSASNQVKVAGSAGELTVNLKGTGEATLAKASTDTSKVVSSMKDFISSYNDAVKFVDDNKQKSGVLSALNQSFSYRSLGSSALRAVGIDVDSKGRLSLNEGQFVQTLKDNPKQIEKVVGGYSGLAGITSSKAQSAIIAGENLANHYLRSSGTYNSSGQAVGFFYNMVI